MFYNKPICPKLIDIALVLSVKTNDQIANWIGTASGLLPKKWSTF